MRVTATAAIAAAALALAACSGDADPAPTVSSSAPSPTASAAALDDRPVDEQLLAAVTAGDAGLVALALDAGADPDAAVGDEFDNTAFSLAITRDDPAMVRALLAAGATIENPQTGFTELIVAARHAGGEVAAALVAAGADPNGLPPLEGWPLAESAYEGNVAVMTVLLEAGADPNAEVEGEDGFSYTPLFSAAYGGSREAADLLLRWGADPAWVDQAGDSAGDVAAGQGHRELGECLDSWVISSAE
ncbi:ankyrin repeat domain-containing protein [Demequina activiva]|uniref:Ankyrin repeat domain-containing protein n=1 Tax=Demequina activiva TaxID=1582364 RepID=A0A919Q4A6_9MICO|nr:ankyrin repeat domain-containing protein [Demequina activiva]GIG54947.1 hypothetical protein Dac01nite_16990 [Demequina activiva]